MSLTTRTSDLKKFKTLLELAQQQITALDADDMPAFDTILAAKTHADRESAGRTWPSRR